MKQYIPAILTALFWGISYGSCEQALKSVDKKLFLFLTGIGTALFWSSYYLVGKSENKIDLTGTFWFLLSISAALLGNFYCLKAIQEMGSVRASVIEISYPIFCALFIMLVQMKITMNIQQIICMFIVIFGSAGFIWFGKS